MGICCCCCCGLNECCRVMWEYIYGVTRTGSPRDAVISLVFCFSFVFVGSRFPPCRVAAAPFPSISQDELRLTNRAPPVHRSLNRSRLASAKACFFSSLLFLTPLRSFIHPSILIHGPGVLPDCRGYRGLSGSVRAHPMSVNK